ncbi:MAG: lytic murein transglycosylase, partial [Solirubrobacterales bacterium]
VGPGGPSGSGRHGGRHQPGNHGNGGTSTRHGNGAGNSNQPTATPPAPPTTSGGVPTTSNPTVTIGGSGPAPLGVPNFVINQFEIPPFLLPIYQACGSQYGIPWQVLASINKIETAFGTNLNVSTAGAIGWMQFIPSTWQAYGVDANGDGRKDPYNPVDAICAAARYLKAAGGDTDLRGAIFAYNHAGWYVDEVLLYARQYGNLPDDLVGSLTGLTEGDRFPVTGEVRYADDISARAAAARAKPTKGSYGNAADVISSSPTRQGINIFAHEGAKVVAVNDGTIVRIGENKSLGKFVVMEDDYGNRFTYASLGSLSKVYAVPKRHKLSASDFKLVTPGKDKTPSKPATRNLLKAGKPEGGAPAGSGGAKKAGSAGSSTAGSKHRSGPVNTENARPRVFALPERPNNVDQAGITGQLDTLLSKGLPGYSGLKSYFNGVLGGGQGAQASNSISTRGGSMQLKPLRAGSHVVAGTVLGKVGKTTALAPHANFSIRPAGKGAPKIDPKPILDGWKLLEATAIYRSAGENPFTSAAGTANVTQDLLLGKTALQRKVLNDPRLSIYACGRNDIQTGQIDQRVLATMEYLADNGYKLAITSLKCGHSTLTTSGNVSEHTTGDAMDIASINGVPVAGHQGPGTLTDSLIKTVLQLQGSMQPHQVISLEDLPGPISFPLPDHWDHVHIGVYPVPSSGYQAPFVDAIRGRIDQGVDYVGTGPIKAIGKARILKVGAPGWPGGQGVLYRLLDGSRAGSVVYVNEGIQPTVRPGELVLAGQQIGTFVPGSPTGIEIGFADSSGVPLSHASYHEGDVTRWGRKMATFLSTIGAPGQLNDRFSQLMKPKEWNKVIKRLGQIPNPSVPTAPSRFSLPAHKHSGKHAAHSD